ncbi:MAG: TolC family protein [Candidatus Aceula meridiana]|nr:TolC family protein [Candidatus Aceula meridiana]
MKTKDMKQKMIFITLVALGMALCWAGVMMAEEKREMPQPLEKQEDQETRTLPLEEFITLAAHNDTEFERILIDELSLQYQKAINLPAGDLVLAAKGQYDFIFGQERKEGEGTLSLTKLFPFTGTSLEAQYITNASYSSASNSSEVGIGIAQPIAENAFGKATRLKDKIIGVEVDVAKYQIIEAYEDYLATIIIGYYDWYEAYESLKIGESSYQQNMKLFDNILERQKNNIALPVDVNKVHLQVLAKKEKLIELKEVYAKTLNFVEKAIRHSGQKELVPEAPGLYSEQAVSFEKDFQEFKEVSRTYEVLNLLEKKSFLEVDKEADDLLPSINLLFGYNVQGKNLSLKNEDSMVYAGISLDWPIGDQVDRAEHEVSKINLDKTRLSNTGTHFQLYTDIKNLSVQMESEEKLLNIAKEKIDLARSILQDETENYSFGRITLNDYIAAVNVVDTNRFNEIFHDLQYKKLFIEWLRMTDKLVSKEDVHKK